MKQQWGTYVPTTSERKLITTLADPGAWELNITELCERAGISRQQYYRIMEKPEVLNLYHEQMQRLLRGKIGDVLQATFRFATECPQNHQDRKLLLEMAGIYQSKPQEVTGVAIGVSFENFLETVAPAIEGTKLEEGELCRR